MTTLTEAVRRMRKAQRAVRIYPDLGRFGQERIEQCDAAEAEVDRLLAEPAAPQAEPSDAALDVIWEAGTIWPSKEPRHRAFARAALSLRPAPVAEPAASGAGGDPANPLDDSDREYTKPIGYLPAYELGRLHSGHDANLRSAKFGPSPLDADVPVYLAAAAPPQPVGEAGDIARDREEIKAAINELANGATYPDLLDAVDRLADRAARSKREEVRKPLTKDQVDFILGDAFLAANGSVYSTRVYDFVKAIEREHGIAAAPTTSGGE